MFQKNKVPPRNIVLDEVRRQCIQYTVMLLRGTLHLEPVDVRDLTAATHKNNPFLQIMLKRDLLPQGFLAEMIYNTYHDYELLTNVGLAVTFYFLL